LIDIREALHFPGWLTVGGAPGAYDAFWLAERLRSGEAGRLLHVALDDRAMGRAAETLTLLVPGCEILLFPAWDCLPYDRVGPNGAIAARRIDTLYRLARGGDGAAGGLAVLTTVNAVLQRVPPPETYAAAGFEVGKGAGFDLDGFRAFAAANGYARAEMVMEPGEYALRGGLVDVFPPGLPEPVRLDLFGDEVERIRRFDPLTQISTGDIDAIVLKPVNEVLLTEDSVARFRTGYRTLFGAAKDGDELYESVSAGRRMPGMEHWLPLFHERLAALPDYLPDAAVSLADGAAEAIEMRLEQIEDYYRARRELGSPGAAGPGGPYNPLPPERLYLTGSGLEDSLGRRSVIRFSAFAPPRAPGTLDAGARLMRSFAAEARGAGTNAFDLASAFAKGEAARGQRVVVACASRGSVARLGRLLAEHGFGPVAQCATWSEVEAAPRDSAALVRLDIDQGFTVPGLTVIAEPDILGRKLARPQRRNRAAEAFLAELAQLNEGDLVVHLDHGIGRYSGLVTLEVASGQGRRTVPHDCLCVMYAGDDKLFVPVENIDVLTRYGEDEGGVGLDRLGGVAWQARKSRLKDRIREMAGELLRVAARRALARAVPMVAADGAFEEFCARFPYAETEDQQAAIADTLADMARDRPMDRLICGDVGFGKTEVALRAAFTAVMSGSQVAVVVPTTLLARQHFETFRARFAGLPVEIAQLSRLVGPREAEEVRRRLAAGQCDIVIGTHALLSDAIGFANLGLLVVDEEQHFGVAHKERLKRLKADVHVLTLTATPIPRTLQLALTGVKEMSVIATPPVDRLAIRTFVLPFDPLVIREAIRREMHRGGQCFHVCPRISDIPTVEAQLAELAPEARRVVVHGQMSPARLENAMTAFFERAYDVLVSTNIIESGLDLPNVNTIVVHRADMFGLAQLYQLRGRVGRSALRAYAYLTVPPRRQVTAGAASRLAVMQTLDSLGAGFSLASHDLDIRGAGNLLGEEQSGHIREVGIELYQHMLEETVAELKGGAPAEADWTPQITVDVPVLIPEGYVADLGVRLGLYRRIAALVRKEDVEAFAAELIDRFGPLPAEVENLLAVVALKQDCRAAGVERVEAGPRGCVIAFRDNRFANADGLIAAIASAPDAMRVRPDHSLVIRRDWPGPGDRIRGLAAEIAALARLAAEGDRAGLGTGPATQRATGRP
jgi:transcription-repair coupling factor (superfamily II helicase)